MIDVTTLSIPQIIGLSILLIAFALRIASLIFHYQTKGSFLKEDDEKDD